MAYSRTYSAVLTPTRLNELSSYSHKFSKYKVQIDKAKQSQPTNYLDQIYSILNYTPLFPEKDNSESRVCCIERSSTKQSDHQQLLEEPLIDSFLSSSSISSVRTNLKQEPFFQKNTNIPTYLQQFNKVNSITPNFKHPRFNMKLQLSNLSHLIKICLKAINEVQSLSIRVGKKSKEIRVFAKNNQKKLNLRFFLNSGWDKGRIENYSELFKPRENFRNQLKLNQILYEIDLLYAKISRYQLAVNFIQEVEVSLYNNIRQNLFEAESKLLEISNSLYVESISYEYPHFYYTYLSILRGTCILTKDDLKRIQKQFREMWEIQEPVTCSQIGKEVWNILHRLPLVDADFK